MDPEKKLDAVLDDARQELCSPDLSFRHLNFQAVTQTLPAVPVSVDGQEGAIWAVEPNDSRARYLLRRAADRQRFVVYGSWIEYDSDGHGAMRVAPLLTTRCAYDDEELTATALERPAANRDLMDHLTAHGAVFGEGSVLLEPGQLGARKIDRRPFDHDRIGIALAEPTTIRSYLDHRTHPALLDNRLVKLFASRVEREARPEAETGEPRPASSFEEPVVRVEKDRLDPDQAEAVRLTSSGVDLVIHGPPGTGKSTVIVAIVEAAVRSGARVVVTSTEESALDVARRRLRPLDEQGRRSVTVASPDEIAAVTPATIGIPDYDVLVIDEASRMTLSDALPLLCRAKSVVVIGDERQLPPAREGMTLLDRAMTVGLRRTRLRYHYRSRDRTLITPSNMLAYGLSLRTVPRPDGGNSMGIKMVVCEGATITESERGVINTCEAQAIIARLIQHATSASPRSIAVIAANSAQADHIRAELALALAAAGLTDHGLNPNPEEPFFIRNTGAVQGEERDIVLISFVYRPGVSARNGFGVFDRRGAIERLNVLMSRARQEMIIHLSFRASDFDRSTPLSAGAIAYLLTRKILDALLTTDYRQATPREIASLAKKAFRTSDNLGVVYGLRTDGLLGYDVGLVVRDESRDPAHWDAIVRQLRDTGWLIVDVTHREVQREPDRVARSITALIAGSRTKLSRPGASQ